MSFGEIVAVQKLAEPARGGYNALVAATWVRGLSQTIADDPFDYPVTKRMGPAGGRARTHTVHMRS